MEASAFFLKVDEIIAKDPGTLNGSESLGDTSLFDSLGMLELIIYMDEECGVTMKPEEIVNVGNLTDLHKKLFA